MNYWKPAIKPSDTWGTRWFICSCIWHGVIKERLNACVFVQHPAWALFSDLYLYLSLDLIKSSLIWCSFDVPCMGIFLFWREQDNHCHSEALPQPGLFHLIPLPGAIRPSAFFLAVPQPLHLPPPCLHAWTTSQLPQIPAGFLGWPALCTEPRGARPHWACYSPGLPHPQSHPHTPEDWKAKLKSG